MPCTPFGPIGASSVVLMMLLLLMAASIPGPGPLLPVNWFVKKKTIYIIFKMAFIGFDVIFIEKKISMKNPAWYSN